MTLFESEPEFLAFSAALLLLLLNSQRALQQSVHVQIEDPEFDRNSGVPPHISAMEYFYNV
jgi:hypothetical protein